ncbi:hypothetical protein [Herbiconiux sp. YIM B11900]|uniref:hypothetical protein n=1 Tax=Herbiconiux sp. YIM B11900 TaxID=3404131 RepID=UPI003F82A743
MSSFTTSLDQLARANRAGSATLGRLRTRLRQDRNVSAGHLGLGFALIGGLLMVRGLASLAWSWTDDPARASSALAWVLLAVAFALVVLTARRTGGALSPRVTYAVLAVGVTALGLDLAGFLADSGSTLLYPTATIGFGGCLFASLPHQPLRRSLEGASVLAAGGAALIITGATLGAESLSACVTAVLLGLAPVLAGVSMIQVIDRHIGRLIDHAVADSLVAAPAVGHGVLAVSELRRMDSDAERLLAAVAAIPAGRPIDAVTAAEARELGDQLRRALMADHEQSWLQIAVSESGHLSRTVRVTDPGVLAADLRPEQRRTLLALVWLCVASAPVSAPAPALELLFQSAGTRSAAHDGRPLPTIVFSLAGTEHHPIDPAVWPLFVQLGPHTVDLRSGRLVVQAALD